MLDTDQQMHYGIELANLWYTCHWSDSVPKTLGGFGGLAAFTHVGLMSVRVGLPTAFDKF